MHRNCKRAKLDLQKKTAGIRVCATLMDVYGRAIFGLEMATGLFCLFVLNLYIITFTSAACHSNLANETNPDVSALQKS